MKRKQLSMNEQAIGFVDASPSELIHNSKEKYICIILVYFFHIKRVEMKNISQFKNTRTLKRKLQIQKYIIESIESNNIAPTGILNFNYTKIALENGKKILKQIGIDENHDYSEKIKIGNETMSYGYSLSLGWYSIVLSRFLMQMGTIAKVQNKKIVSILLDLLPGDNIESFRNFDSIEYILNNTELEDFQSIAIEKNNLEKIGYGYGIKDEQTKIIKNELEYVITDWIVQSFFSLLKYEKEELKTLSTEYQLSELARYLISKKVFIIQNAFKIE